MKLKQSLKPLEKAKKIAALEAVKLVENEAVLGLGSGSTASYAIQEIGKRIRSEGLRVKSIPTSHQAQMLAVKWGIPITTLDEHPEPDITIDGADQVDSNLNLIKGLGGALAREKIVASASKKFVVIVDERKLASKLGVNCPVPVEILPFSFATATRKLSELGGKPKLREGKGKVGPVITDNSNFVIDVDFGPIRNLEKLEQNLHMIPGVVETGLFINMADIVYLGKMTGAINTLQKHAE